MLTDDLPGFIDGQVDQAPAFVLQLHARRAVDQNRHERSFPLVAGQKIGACEEPAKSMIAAMRIARSNHV